MNLLYKPFALIQYYLTLVEKLIYTELRNIKKGLTTEVLSTKQGQKLAELAIKELLGEGWLLAKKSTGELHVSLNPKKKKEIMDFVMK